MSLCDLGLISSSSFFFKAEKSETYTLKDEKTFTLVLSKAEPGKYTCEVDGKPVATYDIEAWTGELWNRDHEISLFVSICLFFPLLLN